MKDKVWIYKVLPVLQLADRVLPHLLADLDILLKVGFVLQGTQSIHRFLWVHLVVLFSLHHFRQDQKPGVSLDFFSSHLCLARKDLRRAGMCFLIDSLGSPKRTRRTLSPSFASTANFLDLPGVRLTLLYPENFSLR